MRRRFRHLLRAPCSLHPHRAPLPVTGPAGLPSLIHIIIHVALLGLLLLLYCACCMTGARTHARILHLRQAACTRKHSGENNPTSPTPPNPEPVPSQPPQSPSGPGHGADQRGVSERASEEEEEENGWTVSSMSSVVKP
ncbi:hypothetical protein NFI96_031543 [Prochilodus magdalenae]|nr:hypothetical protein NFI96_031543 [Prochilodus magdalenae]